MGLRLPKTILAVLLLVSRPFATAADADSDLKQIPLRTHSIHEPYVDDAFNSRWFDFGGSTVIRTDEHIRLTSAQPSQSGWLFSKVPLTATNWEIEFEFQISGKGNLFGDGFAMWVTRDRAQPGPVFGMKDEFDGLGIFFDTYKNNRPGTVFPYVMAMLGDGKTKYDQANDGKANELAGCSARGIRNAEEVLTKARVTYFQDKSLTVDLHYKKGHEWTRCFEVPNIKLPAVSYLGFSAETGELHDNHDIVSVETKNLYSPSGQSGGAAGSADYSRNKRPSSSSGGGSWTWTFFKFIMFGMLVAGSYAGYTAYRARRRDRF